MTNPNIPDDDVRDLIRELARKQNTTQDQILDTQNQLQMLTNDTTRVLARSAVLDDVLLELRDNQEILQRNFEIHQQNILRIIENQERNFTEHQRTTNAALNSLEAILLQLTRGNNGN
jgi:hypothetical protein